MTGERLGADMARREARALPRTAVPAPRLRITTEPCPWCRPGPATRGPWRDDELRGSYGDLVGPMVELTTLACERLAARSLLLAATVIGSIGRGPRHGFVSRMVYCRRAGEHFDTNAAARLAERTAAAESWADETALATGRWDFPIPRDYDAPTGLPLPAAVHPMPPAAAGPAHFLSHHLRDGPGGRLNAHYLAVRHRTLSTALRGVSAPGA